VKCSAAFWIIIADVSVKEEGMRWNADKEKGFWHMLTCRVVNFPEIFPKY